MRRGGHGRGARGARLARRLGAALLLAVVAAAPRTARGIAPAAFADDLGSAVGAIVGDEIGAGRVTGAVVVVGHDREPAFRGAFGAVGRAADARPMAADTIFDLASLTKVIATTTAIMQLVDAGALQLDAPVADYWPAFASHGKDRITVRQLLTHTSGLRPGLPPGGGWHGADAALGLVAAERPTDAPGTRFRYSDLNFIALGALVERVSGQSLDAYCAARVFAPLGMADTGYRPSPPQRDRIAPTTRPGAVHDPVAFRMGGVAGHAGVFSTADDLARFARMLLDGGRAGDARILSADAVARMTGPQPAAGVRHGLGWDLDSPYAAAWRGQLSERTFGHTGHTGTALWIDPVSRTYVIVLTNRVQPSGEGDVRPLRRRIAAAVGAALHASAQPAAEGVQAGVDVLAAERFAALAGRRVGLITNQTGVDAAGRRTVDLLAGEPRVTLARLFSPEHGFAGDRDVPVAGGWDAPTALPVLSLYGAVRRPTDAMLDGVDALVFDIQDAGVRFYTYVTTMAYAMEAAARKRIPFYVLDRPNPLNAAVVQGPVLDPRERSFTGYYPLPVRYGMTIGELARFLNAENGIGADLHVVPMRGYRRADWYDDTGLPWVAPSPNLRTPRTAALYPGVALVEGANVSVGRGTDTPFEVVGAPWVDGPALAARLARRGIAGVRFAPVDFRPRADPFRGQLCHGIRILLDDRDHVDTPALGVEIASALHALHPRTFRLEATTGIIGAPWVVRALATGTDPRVIAARWQTSVDEFRARRAHYLLY